jgi:hypothetical protein
MMDKKKRLAKLRYRELILQLHREKKPVRAIEKIINSRLAKTRLAPVTLGKSTIAKIIKEHQ